MNSKFIVGIFFIVLMSLAGCSFWDSANNQPADTVTNSDERQSAYVVENNDESQSVDEIADIYENQSTTVTENNNESQSADIITDNDDNSSVDAVNNYDNQPNNIVSLGFSLLHDGKIYFSDNTGIYVIEKDGSNKQKISDISALNLCVYENVLFFQNMYNQAWLCSMNLDGSNIRHLVERIVGEFQIVNSKIYFTDVKKRLSVYSYDLVSEEIKKITDKEAEHLLVVGNYLYYADWTWSGFLERIDTVNDNVESVAKVSVGPIGVNNSQLFTTIRGELYKDENTYFKKIHDAQIHSFNIYNGKIYYVDRKDELIYRIAVDGTGLVQVSDEKFHFINILEENMLIARKSFNDDSLYLIRMDGDKTVSTTRIN